jgi:serine/threonine-protein kinase 24/25/MST4
VLSAADIGNGVDTIRPVKKVDPVGSLKLSAEYVGSLRREASTSPTSSTMHKRTASQSAKAGESMVDQVILPAIQKVRIEVH